MAGRQNALSNLGTGLQCLAFLALMTFSCSVHARSLSLQSSAFEDGERIPEKYTCDGKGVSPPLTWKGVPKDARDLALVMEDPDAPAGTWIHWVLFNIPETMTQLSENLPAEATLESDARHGRNSWDRIGYGGPCPPRGQEHRYFFRLYALDTPVPLPSHSRLSRLKAHMKGHILQKAVLMGTYRH